MIVCHCKVVNDRAVAASIQDGARSLADVCRSTGAGKSCGGCLFSLRQLLCHHEPVDAQSNVEVAVAAG